MVGAADDPADPAQPLGVADPGDEGGADEDQPDVARAVGGDLELGDWG